MTGGRGGGLIVLSAVGRSAVGWPGVLPRCGRHLKPDRGWFISLPDAPPPQPCYTQLVLVHPMKGTHSPRQVAFNYLADHNDAHEASRACHASGKAGSAGNKKKRARR